MIAVLLIALILDAMFGEPDVLWHRIPHPAALMGRAVGALDRQLNSGSARKAKGVGAVMLLVLGAWLIGSILVAVPGVLIEAIVAAILLAQRSLSEHVLAVADSLDKGLDAGRRAVAMIVGRKTETLDQSGIARSAIESGAENLSDGVIAPAFWFLVGGLPGLLIYKVVNTADSMIGYRTPRHAEFGWAAARLDDVLNLIPARLTAGLIALASGQPRAVWSVVWADAGKHRSPNAGWPESAMAATLGVALSGPRQYEEGPSTDPYLNASGQRELDHTHIRAAVRIMWRSWAIGLGVLFVLMVLA
ncbi:adenosylcobinamide-phosphate synthase CbiB [Pontivivens insulae]|uniref:Cobalamin biosynthesis protein CobD n=1 Tax=Pontivivens insulae TaxID=1639689 RepID=A0A2R8AFK8_9RHOB|nr:adenosylcobinamide-phosphate synthase CbiB [Pontivivens insulae]RED12099.1 adenosylcobinamide-phosphate synthase [Pontivivens insulae]SPF30855.1 Cobalamin biosynthesis protein CobD [Pontivivens insulae]